DMVTHRIITICVVLQLFCNVIWTHAQLAKELPDEFRPNLPILESDTFRNKCIAVLGDKAGSKAFDEIESNFGMFSECMVNIVNHTAIQQEIQEATPRGELDVVFNKYCNKRSDAIHCFDDFTSIVSPCLEKDEQESPVVIKRIVQSLLNFVCHKNGDQIALFIGEKGPECLQAEKQNIQHCFNSTFSAFFDSSGFTGNKKKSMPKLIVGQKQCDVILSLQTCVVARLETCPDITPANLVESMFKFIRNETLCRKYQKSHPESATINSGSKGFTQL
ncbi:hypothetical protein KR067_003744, partial [Drosophila pandora]